MCSERRSLVPAGPGWLLDETLCFLQNSKINIWLSGVSQEHYRKMAADSTLRANKILVRVAAALFCPVQFLVTGFVSL